MDYSFVVRGFFVSGYFVSGYFVSSYFVSSFKFQVSGFDAKTAMILICFKFYEI